MSSQIFILLHILAVLVIACIALGLYIFSIKKEFPKKIKWLIIGLTSGVGLVVLIITLAVFWSSVMPYAQSPDRTDHSVLIGTIIAVVLIIFAVLLTIIVKQRKGKNIGSIDGEIQIEADDVLSTSQSKLLSTKNITRMAIFTAVALILYLVAPFNIPALFPGFLEFNFSDVPVLLAGFMMGPVAGVIVLISKILLKLPFSATVGVGELGDLMFGLAFMLPATIIYMFFKNKKGALIGLSVGVIASLGVAILANRFILVPFYANILFGNLENLINITGLNRLYPNMTADNFFRYYILLAVIPFNLIRLLISGAVTFILYKHLSRASKHLFDR